MTSELIKRIFTSAILLLFIFFILIKLNEDYFKYFLIFAGIFCFGEWVLTNVVFLKRFMIVNSKVDVSAVLKPPVIPKYRLSNQAIDLQIDLKHNH